MSRLKKKYLKSVGLFWTACLAVFLPAYFLVLAPQQQSRDRLRNELNKKGKTYEDAQAYALQQEKGMPKKEIQNLRQTLRSFVFDFRNTGALTFDIGQVATGSTVEGFSVKLLEERADAGMAGCRHIDETYVDVKFDAGFHAFLTLLNALERHQPVVFVDSFSIKRSARGGLHHPVNMKLAVFVTKQQNNTGSGTTHVIGEAGVF
jgi:hypothetical protein